MENWIILTFFAFSGGLLGGFLAQLVKATLNSLQLAVLEGRVRRLETAGASAMGAAARNKQGERQAEAVAYLAGKVAENKAAGQDEKQALTGALKDAAMAYPDVALSLGGKLLKGQGKGGIAALLGGGD